MELVWEVKGVVKDDLGFRRYRYLAIPVFHYGLTSFGDTTVIWKSLAGCWSCR